jgi:hypothetical protein
MAMRQIEKNLQSSIDEILFGSADKALSQQISRLEKVGKNKKYRLHPLARMFSPRTNTTRKFSINETPEKL